MSRHSAASAAIGQQSWLPPSHLAHPLKVFNHKDKPLAGSHTPNRLEASPDTTMAILQGSEPDSPEDERQIATMKDLLGDNEMRIGMMMGRAADNAEAEEDNGAQYDQADDGPDMAQPPPPEAPKKAARVIDEDNYDDDDDDESDGAQSSPLLTRKNTNAPLSPSKSGSSPVSSDKSPIKHSPSKEDGVAEQPKSSEDARKQLEDAKMATEKAAKRTFNTFFYTLENDRSAMLEHQKLEESEQQIDAEMGRAAGTNNGQVKSEQQGTLSQANLGSSSLTLKHLIARIDLKRERVKASDAELRSLMNEVRKNRSKYASEDLVNQEELYEALDKVLSELKAMLEYSQPFLGRVNKREAPDYYNIIKHPMDLGSMSKKLKLHTYKSKLEFTRDLDLIWANCLKYNAKLDHPLRKNAIAMRKEADKLVPLIPDLVIRPRAEVEAEERRKANGGDDDAADDSDDEPIMSSRGRKATGAKGSTKARKNASGRSEGTPGVETKPTLQLNGLLGVAHEGSDAGGESNGFATPPINGTGSVTPGGFDAALGSQAELDDGPSLNGITLSQSHVDASWEDEEYKIWKQITKKDRALTVRERNRTFKADKMNIEEPATLRSKKGMSRWLRQQYLNQETNDPEAVGTVKAQETLAEGMEIEEERIIPDYYDPVSAIPDVTSRLQWIEDADGIAIDRQEECLRMVPAGLFTAPKGALSDKVEANMRQMQETRKICSKIGVIKQMQLQAQMYNNQFPKYEPQSFVEADIEAHVTSDDGPIMSQWVCKTALSRSVAKLCYHVGFEELQPSALDAITDIAEDYFGKLARAFNIYREAPKIPAITTPTGAKWQERFTNEEVALHALNENGIDIESLESYVKDDVERFGGKLTVMHERMKAHLADLLRPALTDAGPDGSGAFNDGSEQFVGGDFAEELGEDFFGFKALGLDSEFGMASLAVPLHLINHRLHNTFSGPVAAVVATEIFPPLPPLEPVTIDLAREQIGLVRNFFMDKLRNNDEEPLLDDADLPGKQKQPKPRLGPTGKITSPRKRPAKEMGGAKKKKKLEGGAALVVNGGTPPKAKKIRLLGNGIGVGMERAESSQGAGTGEEKDEMEPVGMISPESIDR